MDKEMLKKAEIAFHKKSGNLEAAQELSRREPSNNEIKPHPNSKSIHFLEGVDKQGFIPPSLLIIDEFLEEVENNELFNFAMQRESHFRLASIGFENTYIDTGNRSTLALYETDDIRNRFCDFITHKLNVICNALNIDSFAVEQFQTKITNHIDGGFFNIHSDKTDQFGSTINRALSWIYYFHHTPKPFEGGELYLFDTNRDSNSFRENAFVKVNPINNRFIIFPSYFFHGVAPTSVPSGKFQHGRLAVAGHVYHSS